MKQIDVIKNMTVDEMAKFLKDCDDCYRICNDAKNCAFFGRSKECEQFIKQWLESETM